MQYFIPPFFLRSRPSGRTPQIPPRGPPSRAFFCLLGRAIFAEDVSAPYLSPLFSLLSAVLTPLVPPALSNTPPPLELRRFFLLFRIFLSRRCHRFIESVFPSSSFLAHPLLPLARYANFSRRARSFPPSSRFFGLSDFTFPTPFAENYAPKKPPPLLVYTPHQSKELQ